MSSDSESGKGGTSEGQLTIGNISFSVLPVLLPKGAEISTLLTEDDVRRIVREEISKYLEAMVK